MIRGIVLLIGALLAYYAVRTVVRSAISAYRAGSAPAGRQVQGHALVLDPQCRTYVVQDRAIMRTVRGTPSYFCSEECARAYEARGRS